MLTVGWQPAASPPGAVLTPVVSRGHGQLPTELHSALDQGRWKGLLTWKFACRAFPGRAPGRYTCKEARESRWAVL